MNKITKIAATLVLSAVIIGLSTFIPNHKSGSSLNLGSIRTDKSETFHSNLMAVGGWYVEQVSSLADLKF